MFSLDSVLRKAAGRPPPFDVEEFAASAPRVPGIGWGCKSGRGDQTATLTGSFASESTAAHRALVRPDARLSDTYLTRSPIPSTFLNYIQLKYDVTSRDQRPLVGLRRHPLGRRPYHQMRSRVERT